MLGYVDSYSRRAYLALAARTAVRARDFYLTNIHVAIVILPLVIALVLKGNARRVLGENSLARLAKFRTARHCG